MVGELPDTSNTVAAMRAAAGPAAEDTPEARELRRRRDLRGWGVDRMLLTRIGNALTKEPYPMPGAGGDNAGAGGDRPATTLADIGL